MARPSKHSSRSRRTTSADSARIVVPRDPPETGRSASSDSPTRNPSRDEDWGETNRNEQFDPYSASNRREGDPYDVRRGDYEERNLNYGNFAGENDRSANPGPRQEEDDEERGNDDVAGPTSPVPTTVAVPVAPAPARRAAPPAVTPAAAPERACLPVPSPHRPWRTHSPS